MKSIVVFCGSSTGNDSQYLQMATTLGKTLASQNIRLIYGGAKLGLMGIVADAALQNGGEVIGVIPGFLQTKEVAHEALTEMILVDTMHERKMKMHELSDGIICLPGGWGTMEELFEMLTWAQLGLHQKPIGLMNINAYYEHLLLLHQKMADDGFLKPELLSMLLVSESPVELLVKMKAYRPPVLPKWLHKQNA